MPAEPLIEAALLLARSAAGSGFRGPDPYDGLWWSWPRPLVAGRRRRQLLIQAHARSPVDLRRLYRRGHPRIAKTLGVFSSVGARAHRLTGDRVARQLAVAAADLLCEDRSAGDSAWGYPFDTQTRWSFYPAGRPNVVATAFAAGGLTEVADALARPDLAARAAVAGRWVLEELWVERDGYFAYHREGQPVSIHNASLLGAWLVHVLFGEDPLARERVGRAVERVLAAQRPDGSWPYGERSNLGWADSFHSGYVLTCLDRLADVDPRVPDALARGATHYREFFDARGRALLWAGRPFPEDGHSAGTGLSALAMLRRRGLVEPELLDAVARRVLDAGLHRGHVVHRRYRWGRSTVRYPRWCDAHVALGLVDAASAARGGPDLAPARQAANTSA